MNRMKNYGDYIETTNKKVAKIFNQFVEYCRSDAIISESRLYVKRLVIIQPGATENMPFRFQLLNFDMCIQADINPFTSAATLKTYMIRKDLNILPSNRYAHLPDFDVMIDGDILKFNQNFHYKEPDNLPENTSTIIDFGKQYMYALLFHGSQWSIGKPVVHPVLH